MAATDATPVPIKNQAYRHYFCIRKNDGTLITSWAGADSERSLDGATFADCTNEATEIGTTGCGYVELTATEMNTSATVLKVTVTNTDALPYVVTLFPVENGDIPVDVTQVGGQTASATGAVDFDDIAAILDDTGTSGVLVSSGTGTGQISLSSGTVTVGTNSDKSGYALRSDGLDLVTTWTVGITGNITGNLSGSVGSVTGNVGGNVVGSVANVTGGINTAAGTITTLDGLDTAQDSQHSTTQSNIAALNNLSEADVNAQVDLALADYDAPTNTEMVAAFTEIKGATWSSSTDTLEAIRDRGDAAWTTGAGGTPPDLLQSTTIATLASQTSFTLTAGSTDNDAYNGAIVIVTDQSTSTQKAVGSVSDYVGSTRTVTLAADPGIFTMAVGDTIDIIAATGTGPTAAAIRAEIDSNSTQLAAIVEDTGTTLPATLTTINNGVSTVDGKVDDIYIDTQLIVEDTGTTIPALFPANFADLAITVTTGLVSVGTNNDKTGYSISGTLNTLDDIAGDPGTTLASVESTLVADVLQVQADVTSILTDTGTTIPAQITALNDPTPAAIADAVWGETQSGYVTAGTFGYYLDSLVSAAGGGGLTPEAIADQVWRETLLDHSGQAGSTAEQLAAAGAGGDPWATALPGAYTSGQAGNIIGNRLDATVSSRAATGVTVVTRSHTASTISIIRGDDYDGTAQDAFTWDAGKNIDGGSVTFTIRDAFDDSSIFTTSGSASGTTVTVSLTDVQTLTLPIGTHKFDVQLTLSGGQIQTVAFGDVTVIEDQTRA